MAKAQLNQALADLILKHGQEYEPALLPDDIQRGAPGICFDWCAVQTAMNKDKYIYVEGMALDPDKYVKGEQDWILHAWMTDAEGKYAYDPTWRAVSEDERDFVLPTHYIGIPMEIHQVAGFMRITGYQGLLANRFRSPHYVDRVIKAGV